MPKIEFSDKKILNLKNVISKEYVVSQHGEEQKHANMLATYIKSKNIETMGPLILYSGAIKRVDKDGNPVQKSKVMVQCKNNCINNSISEPYKWEGDIRIEECLYARFNDFPDKSMMASFKLTLYAYENDIEMGGDTYQVIVDRNKETKKVILDWFMPLRNKESN